MEQNLCLGKSLWLAVTSLQGVVPLNTQCSWEISISLFFYILNNFHFRLEVKSLHPCLEQGYRLSFYTATQHGPLKDARQPINIS